MSRHICCCCGRKRHKVYLIYGYPIRDIRFIYKKNWRCYPSKNSYKCIIECLPYAGEVHVTAVNKW